MRTEDTNISIMIQIAEVNEASEKMYKASRWVPVALKLALANWEEQERAHQRALRTASPKNMKALDENGSRVASPRIGVQAHALATR